MDRKALNKRESVMIHDLQCTEDIVNGNFFCLLRLTFCRNLVHFILFNEGSSKIRA